MAAEVPDSIVRAIVQLVIQDESPGNRLLYMTALNGVCQHWRKNLCAEVLSPIAFDGADTGGIPSKQATLAKFRKSDVAQKHATFLGASKLLTGYSEVTLSGEAVTDEVLYNISKSNGSNLLSLKLVGASRLTDAGIIALVRSAPRLKTFILEEAGLGVVGTFIPAILQLCKQLDTLHVEGAGAISWQPLQQRVAWMQLEQLHLVPEKQHEVAAVLPSSNSSGQVSTVVTFGLPAAAVLSGCGHAGTQPELAPPPHSSVEQQGVAAAVHLSISSISSPADVPDFQAAAAAQPGDHAFQQQQQHLQGVAGQGASSSNAGGLAAHQQLHHPCRLISNDSSNGDESDTESMGGASDSTSISVPAATTEALALQLQSSSLQSESSSQRLTAPHHPQHSQELPVQEPVQLQQPLVVPLHSALRRLHVRFANVDDLQQLLEHCPGITDLQLDGPAHNIDKAAVACQHIKRLSYLVSNPAELDAALFYLNGMRNLRGLELEVKGMMMSTEQLRVIGMLPLRELALDSHAYRQQPSMPRPQYSHLDNEGVKGLVDSICNRMRNEMMPLKLSLCGATALKQEAVSALLRLPMLTAIDTGGCIKLTPMDRMRLVAKVKAGQGMLDSRTTPASGALASLRVPHQHAL